MTAYESILTARDIWADKISHEMLYMTYQSVIWCGHIAKRL